MRLLFNNNLSHRLVFILAEAYPDSPHVKDAGPENAADTDVWDYAKDHVLRVCRSTAANAKCQPTNPGTTGHRCGSIPTSEKRQSGTRDLRSPAARAVPTSA